MSSAIDHLGSFSVVAVVCVSANWFGSTLPTCFSTSNTAVLLCRWYFGDIKRQEGVRYLEQPGNKHGAFLIRKSENRPNQSGQLYALSALDGDIVRHYRIKTTDEGKFFISRRQEFSTLNELVEYYSNVSDGLMVLREPCIKVSIIHSLIMYALIHYSSYYFLKFNYFAFLKTLIILHRKKRRFMIFRTRTSGKLNVLH